ncbi:MAG: hypothetical protein E7399_09295 [Ruminococcaceae bacterium]|nr:hypothetical protein [Oscillospiraceae bacterium]
MAEHLSEILKHLLEQTDQKKMKEALPRLMELLSNPQGQQLVQKIKEADPERLAALLGQIDMQAASKKMDRAEVMLEQAGKDPNYVKQLMNLL